MRAGEHIKDKYGKEWIIVRSFPWPKWIDYDLIEVESGEYGYSREYIRKGKE